MNIQPLLAQPSFPKQNRAILRMGEEGECGQSPALTEEQAKALEALQHAYMAEAMPLRRDLIVLRLELRYLVQDPNVQSKFLFDQQKKISELRAKLDDLSLSYQIKARSIFTKEQLERLPPDFSMGMGTGFGTDIRIGRGVRKGIR
jgi:Spy/CpxP family protein refolding chaperone